MFEIEQAKNMYSNLFNFEAYLLHLFLVVATKLLSTTRLLVLHSWGTIQVPPQHATWGRLKYFLNATGWKLNGAYHGICI